MARDGDDDLAGAREADLTRMLTAAPVRVWLLDAQHRVRWCNREAAALFGAEPAHLRGAALESLFGPDEPSEDMALREGALRGEAGVWRGWSLYRDGRRRHTERHYIPAAGGRGYFELTTDQTALLAAQEAAARAGRLLRDAVEALPEAVGIEDATGALVAGNRVYADVYGRPLEALFGLAFPERSAILAGRITHLQGRPVHGDALGRFAELRAGPPAPVEATLADGRDLLIQRAPTADGGRVIAMTDVTALRAREREAAEARALLEDAVGALDLGFAVFGPDGGLSLWNAPLEDFLGADALRQGAALDALTAAFEDGGEPGFAAALSAALDAGEAPERRLADGRLVALSRRPTRQGGAVMTVRDVTERRRAEAALREAWEVARDVLEACPAPILMSRAADGEIIYENTASRAMMRKPSGAVYTQTGTRWASEAERAAFRARIARDGRVVGYEGRFRRYDGTVFPMALSVNRIQHRGEAVHVSFAQDLTERRAREAELARQRRLAQEAEKMGALGEVLAGISHELNNPLSVLVGQAAILRETATDEPTRRRAERLAAAADRCARIVRGFMAIARQRPGAVATLDLGALAREAAAAAAGALAAAGAETRLRLARTPALIRGDADQLRQVVVNLLTNAAQAMARVEGTRRVTVSIRRDARAGRATLTVADTGPGVPAALAGHIFQPLFTTREGEGGSGLGLALCRRIVATHGGRIAHRPRPGGGAVFAVTLPLDGAGAVVERGPDFSPRGLRLLVVDPDPELARTAAEVASLDAHRADVACAIADALEMAERARYDLILCAARLPDGDGAAFHAALQGRAPDQAARVVFVLDDGLDAHDELSAAGRPMLEKPIMPQDIRAAAAAVGMTP